MDKDTKTETTEKDDGSKTSNTYSVDHDPLTDALTGGEGTKGERTSTTETEDKNAA